MIFTRNDMEVIKKKKDSNADGFGNHRVATVASDIFHPQIKRNRLLLPDVSVGATRWRQSPVCAKSWEACFLPVGWGAQSKLLEKTNPVTCLQVKSVFKHL